MTVVIRTDPLGPCVHVVRDWSPDDAAAIAASGLRRLCPGPVGGRLDYLAELAALGGADVVDRVDVIGTVDSDVGVTALRELRSLGLEDYARDRIDFGAFPRLERLHVRWRPGVETAFEVTTLRSLSLGGYRRPDLTPLAALRSLEGLSILNSRSLASLDGIEALGALRVLSLGDDAMLADIGALGRMDHSLEEITLQVTRKVRDIGPLAAHPALRRVSLIDGGRIASLAPLAGLAALEELYFYGSTVIEDGDMSPLLGLPALRRVAFAPRRHYSHRPEDIERLRGLSESAEVLPHWRW